MRLPAAKNHQKTMLPDRKSVGYARIGHKAEFMPEWESQSVYKGPILSVDDNGSSSITQVRHEILCFLLGLLFGWPCFWYVYRLLETLGLTNPI